MFDLRDPRLMSLRFDQVEAMTTATYDALLEDITSRHMLGDAQPGDWILACLLTAGDYRYYDIKNSPWNFCDAWKRHKR